MELLCERRRAETGMTVSQMSKLRLKDAPVPEQGWGRVSTRGVCRLACFAGTAGGLVCFSHPEKS